jgi:hypothetical protein
LYTACTRAVTDLHVHTTAALCNTLHYYCNTALQQEIAIAKDDYNAMSEMYHIGQDNLDFVVEQKRSIAIDVIEQCNAGAFDNIKFAKATVVTISYIQVQAVTRMPSSSTMYTLYMQPLQYNSGSSTYHSTVVRYADVYYSVCSAVTCMHALCLHCAPALANTNTRCLLICFLYLQQHKRWLHDAKELNKDQAIHINKLQSENAQLTRDLFEMFQALVLSNSKVCTHIAQYNSYKST